MNGAAQNRQNMNSTSKKPLRIILSWEIRRLFFNIILITGIVFCLKILDMDIWQMEMGSGDYLVFLIYVGHLVVVNLIYTLGWIIDLTKPKNPDFARSFTRSVLGFSLIGLLAITASIAFLLWG